MQVETKLITKIVIQELKKVVQTAFPTIQNDPLLQNGPKNQCQYVSPVAMKEFNMNRDKKAGTSLGCKNVVEFAQKIVDNLKENDIIGSIKANEKGFLQIKVKDSFVENSVNDLLKNLDFPEVPKQRIVVDFSSPNIAKEMHVGHLRSTIIGESICRLFEYVGHNVTRANHVGDWGTQFGMLIAYMKLEYPDYEQNTPEIKDLDAYYKAARQKFDSDPEFKKLSQLTVVKLQAYDEECIKAWKMICDLSRKHFTEIYKRLDIKLEEFGESFYNERIPPMIEELTSKNLIKEDDTVTKKRPNKKAKKAEKKAAGKGEGKVEEKVEEPEPEIEEKADEQEQSAIQEGPKKKAKCMFFEKYSYPLIVVKSDGGYNYDTTDLACIKYRLQELKADRIVYITGSGQREHFEMIWEGAKQAGWLTTQRAEHMGFGVILGEDKKMFSSRKGVAVRLLDLINEAKSQALQQLKNREKDTSSEEKEESKEPKEQSFTALKPEQYEESAEKLGSASIKYFDLKQNRTSDYVYDESKMLDPRGNTAIYLIYAYVRMCSIIRKSGLTSNQIEELAKNKPFKLTHEDERILAGMLIKFYDVVYESTEELAINKMTDFIYEICVKVQENYKKYRIVGDENMESRIILCEAIRRVLHKAFFMVGIVPIEKI